jgi:hypothetical protein
MSGRPNGRQVTGIRGAAALVAGALVLGFGVPARAADQLTGNGSGMDTHLFRPAMDSKGLFDTNGTEIIGNSTSRTPSRAPSSSTTDSRTGSSSASTCRSS